MSPCFGQVLNPEWEIGVTLITPLRQSNIGEKNVYFLPISQKNIARHHPREGLLLETELL
jgi:hypothetical protein